MRRGYKTQTNSRRSLLTGFCVHWPRKTGWKKEKVEMVRPAFKCFLRHAQEGKGMPTQTLMKGNAMPCACIRGLLSQMLMMQMAGDPCMCTHAPASDPGSAALLVAKSITLSIKNFVLSYEPLLAKL